MKKKPENKLLVGISDNAIFGATKSFIESTGDAVAELCPRTFGTSLKKYDLIIFTGGSDISPHLYGQENKFSYTQPDRDEHERNLFRFAERYEIPIFGICRGLQLLNVLFGGSLYQDLFSQCGREHEGYHDLSLDSLTNIFLDSLKKTNYKVNSLHHQGIRSRGRGVNVVATYQQIPEIIYHASHPMWAVQFHPEFMSDDVKKSYAGNLLDWVKRVRGKVKVTEENTSTYNNISFADLKINFTSLNTERFQQAAEHNEDGETF